MKRISLYVIATIYNIFGLLNYFIDPTHLFADVFFTASLVLIGIAVSLKE